MRIQKDGEKITCIPLRFNINKEQWKVVKQKFFDVTITRQVGKGRKAHIELAKEVVAFADQNEVFNLCEKILENWRKANRPILNKQVDYMNFDLLDK